MVPLTGQSEMTSDNITSARRPRLGLTIRNALRPERRDGRSLCVRLPGLLLTAAIMTIGVTGGQARASVSPKTLFRFDTVDKTRNPIGTQLSFGPTGVLYGTLGAPGAAVHPVFYALAPNAPGAASTYQFHKLTSEFPTNDFDFNVIPEGCTPLTGAVFDPTKAPDPYSPGSYLGPFVVGTVNCIAQSNDPPYGRNLSWWTEDHQEYGWSDWSIYAWGAGIPAPAKRPPGWQWWRGYGYAMSPPAKSGSTFGTSWSGQDDYGQIVRIATFADPEPKPENRSSRCGDLKVGTTKEHGFAPNYVSHDPDNTTIWFTTWATTKDSLPVHNYVSGGALWRIKLGKPCELVARFQDPSGHPNGVTPDGKGGAYVTTTGNAWLTNRGSAALDYGGIWHWTPGDPQHLSGLTLLHRFSAVEGGSPMPALAAARGGDFWGITSGFKPGLPFPSPRIRPAQIFKVSAATGSVSFIYGFKGAAEGSLAATQLVTSPFGPVFGATTDARSTSSSKGGGSIFAFTPE